ncbi:uncharacterized protein ACA1_164840 [Acanthamoeba castellanii str. Neff]|uniref:Uncharacterized protein n=1 Tax=Acanthamoeba castellanii (strain ATCC 30010 / Neff) TaxID=1257118 RepID=L8GRS7_ACACF|nr:uncharacterized protein ACA1_164840 [Acanthamoeba castellanii str. Neff]ELR15602.1 hypothetical protein ACA1_164840 [Acanthamoeba castellanii str. Neff]
MMKRGLSWRVAVRWLWVAAAAWAVYGLLLYGHARHPPTALDGAPATQPKTRKELCMVISTVDRPGARYLLQSTASILEGLSEKQLKKSQLLIVNTDDRNTSAEYRADLELLRRTPGVEMIEGSPHVPTADEARADPFVQWLSKERDDYVFTLNQCRSRNPKYILLFEDDVWAADHWYSRLLPNLHKLEAADAQLGSDSATSEWAFVKLYMAVQYDEYDLYLHARDVVFFVSYGVAWGLVAIAAYVVFLVVAHSRRVSAGDRHGHGQVGVWSRAEVKAIVMRDWNTLVCAFIVANVVAAALVAPICISKQSFNLTRKPEGIWPTISRSCAQAQLFKAGPLLDRTMECVMANDYRVTKHGVDLLVSDCARKVGGTVYENIPHLFQHIGIHSSSSVKRKQQDHHAWIPHMSVYFEEGIDAPAHKSLMDFVNSLPDEELLNS